MKKKIFNTLWVVGVLTFAGFCLPACHRELDVQQSYDFALQTMPVQKDIKKGETAEIRCSLRRGGDFADTKYTLRYFQPEGKGILRMDDGLVFKPNDRYPLTREEFRLYYTSQSADRQTIDVYIEDNFGKVQQLTFAFNNKKLFDEPNEQSQSETRALSYAVARKGLLKTKAEEDKKKDG